MGKITAIVLAAGQGRRMESRILKQYMILDGKPLIYYALRAFEGSRVDEVVLVTGADEIEYCRNEIIERFSFQKVRRIVGGGAERYDSVYEGLKVAGDSSYVLIHDGARPLLTGDIIDVSIEGAVQYGACAVGMPVKDTIKIADEIGFACDTPDRRRLWMVQTPQAFSYPLIYGAYRKLFLENKEIDGITDDAMVVEAMTTERVKLVCGSYRNIKITTPEDLAVAEVFLRSVERSSLS